MKTAGVGPEPIDLGQLGNGGQRVLFGDIDADPCLREGAASGRGDFCQLEAWHLVVDREEAPPARLHADIYVVQRLLLISGVNDGSEEPHGCMTSPRMNASHCALFCGVIKRATHAPLEWTA